MQALVISGGGAKGAFAGGIAEYLLTQCRREYDLFVGTSAGSLLVPLLALGEVERLREVFTNVRQRDIFNISPFIITEKNGLIRTRINHLNTVRMFLRGRKTFGETRALRKLIERTLTREDYRRLRAGKKEVLVTVSNLTCFEVEHKSIHDYAYEDFCDWMWASASVIPFMSLVVKDGMEYADGGFADYLPVHPAIVRGAKEVDAIFLRPADRIVKTMPSTNAFAALMKVLEFMLHQIGLDDLIIGHLEGKAFNVKLNCYFTPRILTQNSFVFRPHLMKAWWKEGFEHARTNLPRCIELSAPPKAAH